MIFTDNFLRLLLLDTLMIGVLNSDCPVIHLQKQYCYSEFVFTASLTEPVNHEGPIRISFEKLLKVEILEHQGHRHFRSLIENALDETNRHVLINPCMEAVQHGLPRIEEGEYSMLGISEGKIVNLERIMGLEKRLNKLVKEGTFAMFVSKKNGKFYIDECLPFLMFKWLYSFQRIGLVWLYKIGCVCVDKIEKYNDDMYCKYAFSSMVMSDGKCGWVKSRLFTTCQKAKEK